MKSILFATATVLSFAFLTSCENNDNTNNLPTATEFKTMETAALNSLKQNFTFDAADGISAVSAHGVSIYIPANSLTKNGVAVTGNVDLEFIEIFDGGTMAVTNRPTRGVTPDGKLAMLISGGEFFVNATQNGEQLDLNGMMQLSVPAGVEGANFDMTLWRGVETDTIADGDTAFIWEEFDNPEEGAIWQNGTIGIDIYYSVVSEFGWTNVDCFYNNPGPKTTILADVPNGYDNKNSAVYLSYDGQGNSLAALDTYTEAGLFSEHYGQIPIGLECHAVFITEEDGNYRYAIKPVVITAGGIITFTMSETVTGTKEQLVAAINAVQN